MASEQEIEAQLRSALDPAALDWISEREEMDWAPLKQSLSHIAELLARSRHLPRTTGNKDGVPCVYHFDSTWIGTDFDCWGKQPFEQTASKHIRAGAHLGALARVLELTWEHEERYLAKSFKTMSEGQFRSAYARIREIEVVVLEDDGSRWFAVAWGAQFVPSIGSENIPFRYFGKIVGGELSTVTMATGSDATPVHKIYKAESAKQMEARYQKVLADDLAEFEAREARRSDKSD